MCVRSATVPLPLPPCLQRKAGAINHLETERCMTYHKNIRHSWKERWCLVLSSYHTICNDTKQHDQNLSGITYTFKNENGKLLRICCRVWIKNNTCEGGGHTYCVKNKKYPPFEHTNLFFNIKWNQCKHYHVSINKVNILKERKLKKTTAHQKKTVVQKRLVI